MKTHQCPAQRDGEERNSTLSCQGNRLSKLMFGNTARLIRDWLMCLYVWSSVHKAAFSQEEGATVIFTHATTPGCFGNSLAWKVLLSQQLLFGNYTVYDDCPTPTSCNVCMSLVMCLLKPSARTSVFLTLPSNNDVTPCTARSFVRFLPSHVAEQRSRLGIYAVIW